MNFSPAFFGCALLIAAAVGAVYLLGVVVRLLGGDPAAVMAPVTGFGVLLLFFIFIVGGGTGYFAQVMENFIESINDRFRHR